MTKADASRFCHPANLASVLAPTSGEIANLALPNRIFGAGAASGKMPIHQICSQNQRTILSNCIQKMVEENEAVESRKRVAALLLMTAGTLLVASNTREYKRIHRESPDDVYKRLLNVDEDEFRKTYRISTSRFNKIWPVLPPRIRLTKELKSLNKGLTVPHRALADLIVRM